MLLCFWHFVVEISLADLFWQNVHDENIRQNIWCENIWQQISDEKYLTIYLWRTYLTNVSGENIAGQIFMAYGDSNLSSMFDHNKVDRIFLAEIFDRTFLRK